VAACVILLPGKLCQQIEDIQYALFGEMIAQEMIAKADKGAGHFRCLVAVRSHGFDRLIEIIPRKFDCDLL